MVHEGDDMVYALPYPEGKGGKNAELGREEGDDLKENGEKENESGAGGDHEIGKETVEGNSAEIEGYEGHDGYAG